MINRPERKAKNNVNVNLVYSEENIDFDELTSTKWDLNEKMNSTKHNFKFSKDYENGLNFSKKIFEKDGFSTPILFINQDGLGLNLPVDNFGVNDVAVNVGKDRILNVVDVNTQAEIVMTMKEWCNYFNRPNKDRLLNVISLEFSQTKMDQIVKAPDVVLEIDWLESCWPQTCRDISVDNQSYLKSLTYPKVRKYCLMGTSGCFTDFHIDLGGTSVWYHIFKGEKVFWMVPPTEENLIKFENWCLSADQSSYFFGDLVDKCEKVHLRKGNTFMIPSGWIHGVLTPVDSLVFGGNFLHSFSMATQFRIWSLEERIKVNSKYRYPFFIEMQWYALATFVGKVNGKCYLKKYDNQESKCDIKSQESSPLNDYEMMGIFVIFLWLSDLPAAHKKSVPDKIINHLELLSDAESISKTLPLKSSNCQAYRDLESYFVQLNQFQKDTKKSSKIKKCKLLKKDTQDSITLSITPSMTHSDKKEHTVISSTIHPVRTPSRKRSKLVRPSNPEMPLDMYEKITTRPGSRQIKRPDRLIEAPRK